MSENTKPPYVAGDVVILNSSPDMPMTVQECFKGHDTDSDGNPIFLVNVGFLDATGKHLKRGFPHNMLSLFKPVSDFIQPVGFKKQQG